MPKRGIILFLTFFMAMLAIGGVSLPAQADPPPNTVLFLNQIALNAIRFDNTAPPPGGS
jgi:hypothetical protein